MVNYAWAENAVIIKDDGSYVTYHPKCPYCGGVVSQITTNAHVGAGTTFTSGNCFKCCKTFDIRFGRS